MLDTLSSPLADFVTVSAAVLPSDPGAPAGHSGISGGVWARSVVDTTNVIEMAAAPIHREMNGVFFM